MPSQSTIVEPCLAACHRKGHNNNSATTLDKDNPLECSLHILPKQLLREFHHVFGDKHLHDFVADGEDIAMSDGNNNNNTVLELLAIPTNQRARHDLVAMGDEIEEEKDRLLNCFMDFGHQVCSKLRSLGYWADYIDPCSGLPMLTPHCNKVYSEVDGMEVLLNYRAYNAGFCKVLQHPTWGSAVYPATMFAHAPRQVVMDILKEMYL